MYRYNWYLHRHFGGAAQCEGAALGRRTRITLVVVALLYAIAVVGALVLLT
ncbi:hypothetical protein [Devosia sp. 1566]|uniref:hypothetical protein n=1 Tax=Devosia sp. 1566 TaxID=2499144 RepID=UPI0013E35FFC|nr:hypothetical protein [Devosia sp. 1566]